MASSKTLPDRDRATLERARPLLEGRPVAFVTTMRPDGRMSTNPMALILDGDGMTGMTIRLSTTTNRKKYRNLKADERITICVVQADNLNRYVEIRGRATVEPDEGRAFIDRIARQYMDLERYPLDPPENERVIISVIPERVSMPSIPLADKPPYPKAAKP
jgi:PPOX class probable F420-dependent enzyme